MVSAIEDPRRLSSTGQERTFPRTQLCWNSDIGLLASRTLSKKCLLFKPWLSSLASHTAVVVKNLPANGGDMREAGLIPGSGRFPWRRAWQPRILVWRLLWTEGPDGLQSMESQRVRLDWSDLAHTSVYGIYCSSLSQLIFRTFVGGFLPLNPNITWQPSLQSPPGQPQSSVRLKFYALRDTFFASIKWLFYTHWLHGHQQ